MWGLFFYHSLMVFYGDLGDGLCHWVYHMMLGIVGLPKQCLFLDPKTLTAPTEFTTTPFGTASAGSSPPSSETFATPEIDRNGGPLQRNSAPESHHASQSMNVFYIWKRQILGSHSLFSAEFALVIFSHRAMNNTRVTSPIARSSTRPSVRWSSDVSPVRQPSWPICCTIGTVITFLSPAFSRVTTSNKPIWVWATSQTSQFGLIILLIYN